MRFVVAATGVAVVYSDPSAFAPCADAALTVLVSYLAYSGGLSLWSRRPDRWFALLLQNSHWVDLAWCSVLVALTGGIASLCGVGYLFTTAVASFTHGRAAGRRVTFASTILFASVGWGTGSSQALSIIAFLSRPASLFIIGWVITWFGGADVALRRRLRLMRDVSAIANPRFGVDYTLGHVLDAVRAFLDADECLLVIREPHGNQATLRRSDRRNRYQGAQRNETPRAVSERLLALPDEIAIIARSGGIVPASRLAGWNVLTGARVELSREAIEPAIAFIDARHVLAVPVRRHDEVLGRLFVAAEQRPFRYDDIELISQVIDQVLPVIDNIGVIDHLASDAAQSERRRIARDIHDSLIQSYVGVQLALVGIQHQIMSGQPVDAAIDRLSALVDREVADVRTFVAHLETASAPANSFDAAIQQLAAKFSEATGIRVPVTVAGDVVLTDRVAAEAFQIVREGLSNVRRHTFSTDAAVHIAARDQSLVIRIENTEAALEAGRSFVPRSIAMRAKALGGRLIVDRSRAGRAAVLVQIPL